MENTLEEKAKSKAVNNIINLGTANGWNKETGEFYKQLNECLVPKSQSSRKLGNCYNEYSFEADINGTIYKIVHSVDSSD
jgi:hypothetical protein